MIAILFICLNHLEKVQRNARLMVVQFAFTVSMVTFQGQDH